jgi:hypothetical protein
LLLELPLRGIGRKHLNQAESHEEKHCTLFVNLLLIELQILTSSLECSDRESKSLQLLENGVPHPFLRTFISALEFPKEMPTIDKRQAGDHERTCFYHGQMT